MVTYTTVLRQYHKHHNMRKLTMSHCVLRWLVPLHRYLRTPDKAYWRVVVGLSADTVLCELAN